MKPVRTLLSAALALSITLGLTLSATAVSSVTIQHNYTGGKRDVFTVQGITATSTEERIEVFVKGLLEHMGSDAVPHAVKSGDDVYNVDLVGNSLGMLIGHRGETLDAIQHLTNYVVNREAGKRARINIDAESYRQKREESLVRLANKVAGKVVRYRRNITLEPMNAYERHVIHAALQDTPDVTTYSTGTEPNRRIVVAYSRYRSTDK